MFWWLGYRGNSAGPEQDFGQRERLPDRNNGVLPEIVPLGEITESRILVVEDQDADLRFLDQLLRASGFNNVSLTSDPLTVAETLDPNVFDLVILDLWMPGLDGFSLLYQMRAKVPSDRFLPFLVMTADTTIETRRRALASGATDFLTKPVDVVEVMLRVHHLLEIRRLHSALAQKAGLDQARWHESDILPGDRESRRLTLPIAEA